MPLLAMPQPVLRKRARLFTQRDLARHLGVGRSTIQRIEYDPLTVDASIVVRYLSLLGWRVCILPRVKEERE